MRTANVHPVARFEIKVRNLVDREFLINLLQKRQLQVFVDQNPEEKIPSFQEIITGVNYSVLKPPNSPWIIKYSYKGIHGTTKVKLHNKFNIKKPSFVFHHGLGHVSNSIQLRIIADSTFFNKFNIFSIKASNHESIRKVISNCINKFMNLTLTTCASVLAYEEVVRFHKSYSNQPVVATGFSLGGIVASLHYFYFNTADYYFPIIAYPDVGKIVLNKAYKEIIANLDKLAKNKSLIECFKIPQALKNKPKNKIFPILGEYDTVVVYEDARKFWKGYSIKSFNLGHVSIALKRNQIRKYILSKID